MSGLCKDCRHFSLEKNPYRHQDGFGYCSRWKAGYHIDPKTLADNEVLVEDDEGWGALMGPNFGCILFEAKPVIAVGDGVALQSMAHPPGLIEKMAEAITAGKLSLNKRGRPRKTEAGFDKTEWQRDYMRKRREKAKP
jgi:hypothetical protein